MPVCLLAGAKHKQVMHGCALFEQYGARQGGSECGQFFGIDDGFEGAIRVEQRQ